MIALVTFLELVSTGAELLPEVGELTRLNRRNQREYIGESDLIHGATKPGGIGLHGLQASLFLFGERSSYSFLLMNNSGESIEVVGDDSLMQIVGQDDETITLLLFC